MLKKNCLLFALLCVKLSLFLPGCSFKEPVFPAWETNFRIPFAVEDFIIGEELVNDSTVIIKDNDPNSVIWVSLHDSIEIQNLSTDDLSLKLNDGFENITLDTLTIDTLEIISPEFVSLRQLMPDLSQLVGQTVTISETTLSGPALTIASQTFKRVHFLRGLIRVKVINNLPFTIGPNKTSNGLQAMVSSDSLPNDPFAQVLFPDAFSNGQSASQETIINDKWLYTPIRFTYEMPIAEDTALLITDDVLDNNGFSVIIELLDINTDEIVASLRPQTFEDVIQLEITTKDRLREAVIDRGRIRLSLTNNIPLGTSIRYTAPMLRDAQNMPFTDQFVLSAKESMQRELILDGYKAINIDQPGEIIDSLEIELTATTIPTGNIVKITGLDNISVNVSSDSIHFQSISGIIQEQILAVEPVVEDNIFDYGDFDGDVEFSEVCLELKVFSEVFVENLNADILVTAFHKNDGGAITASSQFELSNQRINGGMPGAPGETRIFISGADRPELLDIINILPTTLRFEGSLRASGEAEIARGNRIWAEYVFETPIKAKIRNLAAFVGDVNVITDANVDSLVRDAVDENVLGADITFNVINRTPLSGAVCFVLTADASDPNIYDAVFDTSMVILDTIAVAPAPIDQLTGFVSEARETQVSLRLNRRQVRLFQNVPLRYGYEFIIDETQDFVTLRYTDFVRMLGEVDTRVVIQDNK